MFGAVLARLYESARWVSPSAYARASTRSTPVSRDSTVPVAIHAVARRRLVVVVAPPRPPPPDTAPLPGGTAGSADAPTSSLTRRTWPGRRWTRGRPRPVRRRRRGPRQPARAPPPPLAARRPLRPAAAAPAARVRAIPTSDVAVERTVSSPWTIGSPPRGASRLTESGRSPDVRAWT